MNNKFQLLCLVLWFSFISASVCAGLATEPVVFTSADWSVKRGKDAMTDKPSCTGLYRNRFDIQLNDKAFFLSLSGRGGVDAYILRFDDEPPLALRLASRTEKDISAMTLEGSVFNKLLVAKRLRVRVSTILGSVVDEDIDLTGLNEAHQYIASAECR